MTSSTMFNPNKFDLSKLEPKARDYHNKQIKLGYELGKVKVAEFHGRYYYKLTYTKNEQTGGGGRFGQVALKGILLPLATGGTIFASEKGRDIVGREGWQTGLKKRAHKTSYSRLERKVEEEYSKILPKNLGYNPKNQTSVSKWANEHKNLFYEANGHYYYRDTKRHSMIFVPKGNWDEARSWRVRGKGGKRFQNPEDELKAIRVFCATYEFRVSKLDEFLNSAAIKLAQEKKIDESNKKEMDKIKKAMKDQIWYLVYDEDRIEVHFKENDGVTHFYYSNDLKQTVWDVLGLNREKKMENKEDLKGTPVSLNNDVDKNDKKPEPISNKGKEEVE